MNRADSCLQRLFRAAAADAPRQVPVEAPFAFENAILRNWRSDAERDRSSPFLPLFRGAFVCACAILLLSIFLSIHFFNEDPADETAVVESAIQLTLMQ
jgi:hypothetical protein